MSSESRSSYDSAEDDSTEDTGPSWTLSPGGFSDKDFAYLIDETVHRDAVRAAAGYCFISQIDKAGIDLRDLYQTLKGSRNNTPLKLSDVEVPANDNGEQEAWDKAVLQLLDTIRHQLSGNRYIHEVDMGDEKTDMSMVGTIRKNLSNYRRPMKPSEVKRFNSNADFQAQADYIAFAAVPQLREASVWPLPEDPVVAQEKSLLERLCSTIESHQESEVFVCSGSLDIKEDSKLDNLETSKPVRLSWIAQDGSKGLIQFPKSPYDDIQRLLDSCNKATFGRGQEDVLDEEYRRAAKLDASQFLTSFDPYERGIIDQIKQVLCPDLGDSQKPHRAGMIAELYSMNIYAAPSGKFRAHVDTPRSETFFASLVVALPHAFEGGDLVVRHQGKEVVLKWSNSDASKISWAAFFGDCEHEVLEVISGQRVTFTYNLYFINSRVPILLQPSSGFDPLVREVSEKLRTYLDDQEFLERGAVFGVYCSHRYPHNQDMSEGAFINGLKGADLVLYSAFKSLNLTVKVGPVLDYDNGGFHRISGWQFVHDKDEIRRLTKIQQKLSGKTKVWSPDVDLRLSYEKAAGLIVDDTEGDGKGDPADDGETGNILPGFQKSYESFRKRKIKGLDRTRQVGHVSDVLIGNQFWPVSTVDLGEDRGDDSELELIDGEFPSKPIPGVLWLNQLKEENEKGQLAALTYGNQSSIDFYYSSVVQLIVIPPTNVRIDQSG